MYWSVLPQPSAANQQTSTRHLAESVATAKQEEASLDLPSLFIHNHNHDHDQTEMAQHFSDHNYR